MPTHPDAGNREPARTYKTTFTRDEDPIAEDGMWLNGATDGVDWTDVVTNGGVAYGAYARNSTPEARAEQGNLETDEATGDYDDPTAILTGDWGPDQFLSGRAYIRNATEDLFQEIQLRVRYELRAGFCTGYEFIFRALDTPAAYVEIVRWNGVIGDWKSLARSVGAEFGIKDGDLIEGRIVGNVLTGSINGRDVISVSDDQIGAGAPGIGYNFGVGHTNIDHGLTEFSADTYA